MYQYFRKTSMSETEVSVPSCSFTTESPYKNLLSAPNQILNSSIDEEKDFKTPNSKPPRKKSKINKTNINQSKKKFKKPVRQKLITQTFKEMQTDVNPDHLQMALALSRSLHETTNDETISKQIRTNGIKKTLEQFGFKSGKPLLETEYRKPVCEMKKRKKSKYQHIRPVLFLRTEEERQNLIETKISTILNNISSNFANNSIINYENVYLHSDSLRKCRYNLKGIFALNNYNREELISECFYVKPLNLPPSSTKCGHLLVDWGSIPGRDKTPPRNPRVVVSTAETELAIETDDAYMKNNRSITPDLFESDEEFCLEMKTNEVTLASNVSLNKTTEQQVTNTICDSNNKNVFTFNTCVTLTHKEKTDFFLENNENSVNSPQSSVEKRINSVCDTRKSLDEEEIGPNLSKGIEETKGTYDNSNVSFSSTENNSITGDSIVLIECNETKLKKQKITEENVIKPIYLTDVCDRSSLENEIKSNTVMFNDCLQKNMNCIEENDGLVDLTLSSDEDTEKSPLNTADVSIKTKKQTEKEFFNAAIDKKQKILSNIAKNFNSFRVSNDSIEFIAENVEYAMKTKERENFVGKEANLTFISSSGSDNDENTSNSLVLNNSQEATQDRYLNTSGCLEEMTQNSKRAEETVLDLTQSSDEESTTEKRVSLKKSLYFHSQSSDVTSQESISISDEELNYSSFHSTSFAGKDKNNAIKYVITSDESEIDDYSSNKLISPLLEKSVAVSCRSINEFQYFKEDFDEYPLNSSAFYCSSTDMRVITNLTDEINQKNSQIENITSEKSKLLLQQQDIDETTEAISSGSNCEYFLNTHTSTLTPLKDESNKINSRLEEAAAEKNETQPQKQNTIETPEAATPKDGVMMKTKNITPMLNYENMDTPHIIKELDKYGLKPLKRRRGVQLLKYIYETTHPIVGDEEKISSDEEEKRSPKKRRSEGNCKRKLLSNEITIEGDALLKSETEADLIFERKRSTKIHSCSLPLHIAFHNLLCSQPELKRKILLYEPIHLQIFYDLLKEQGHKYHIQDLLKFLDRKCITIRTNQCRNKDKKNS